MSIWMSGIDHEHADIALREQITFVSGQIGAVLSRIRQTPAVRGAVLISTCNRTELYLSVAPGSEIQPARLLCAAAGASDEALETAFVSRRGREAVRHLVEVACGLRSQILGEDQIITQVKQAAKLARDAQASDAVLETLFRCAVTAGKEVKTETRLTSVPLSAAHRGVALAEKRLGTLAGKRAVVIGNGEMGRLASDLLVRHGCEVTVTLRSYRHGETIVPRGCHTQPYDARVAVIDGCDLVVSATTSPHYTLTAAQLSEMSRLPGLLVDLALPRDIEPAVTALTGVPCVNMDDLGQMQPENAEARHEAERIVQKYIDRFYEWADYRAALPVISALKHTATERVCNDPLYLELAPDSEEIARFAVEKTIDMLLGGMKEAVSADTLAKCLDKMRKNTASAEKSRSRV